MLMSLLAASVLLLPDVVTFHAARTVDPPQCDTWAESVVGPQQRSLKPVSARWSDGEQLGASELSKLLEADGTSVRLSQPGPGLILDFGEVVSGKIEADALDASGAPVVFSSSESLEFLSVGSDTQAYGSGDVAYRPGGGPESWHAFARRTFRYLLVTLPQPGWADFDRIGVYFTAALGPPSAFKGWFESSEPLLNRIWYRSAYTLQLVSAPGSASALDGTFELWRRQLDMAAARESRLLLARPGSDWRDYTFDFDLTIPPGGSGGGWAIRAAPDAFLALRLALPHGDEPSQLQLWRGAHGGPAALLGTHPLPFELRHGNPYHVRVDAAGKQIVTSVDGHVVSTDNITGLSGGRIGFWAAAGDQFDVGHPRVYSADGALLFEDSFDEDVFLDPARWEGAPQPVLLDGAKRDRVLGLADLAIAARSEYLSFGDWDRVGRLLDNAGAHQYADGKLLGGLPGYDASTPEDARLPDFTLWWILAVGDYVLQSGDVHALDALFPHVQAALAWAERRRQADGLLPKGPGEDWYWSASRGSGPTTSINALYVGSLLVAADLAEIRQQGQVRDAYLREAADLRTAVNDTLWDPAVGAYVDGDLRDHHPLDGNALAVLFGIAGDDRAARALSFLHDQLWTSAGTLTADRAYGGWAQDDAVWPAYVYPEVEARFSLHDDANAFDLLERTWGSMLTHDPSSTFWEYATKDGAIRDGFTSLAHGWSTGALAALSRWVLGVRPVRPGYAEYVIAPHPGDLTWACGAVPTPAGSISVAWQQAAGAFTLWFEAPGGTSGQFAVPTGSPDQVLLDGQPVPTTRISSTELGLTGLSPGPHTIEIAPDDTLATNHLLSGETIVSPPERGGNLP